MEHDETTVELVAKAFYASRLASDEAYEPFVGWRNPAPWEDLDDEAREADRADARALLAALAAAGLLITPPMLAVLEAAKALLRPTFVTPTDFGPRTLQYREPYAAFIEAVDALVQQNGETP